MFETSLDHIQSSIRIIYSLSGFMGVLFILIKNKVFSDNRFFQSDLIKFIVILSFSVSIFSLIGYSTLYKYGFVILFGITFLVNFHYKKELRPLLFSFVALSLSYYISFLLFQSNFINSLIIYFSLAYPLMLFIILNKKKSVILELRPIIYDLIILQVVMSILKLILIGRNEALVGTIGYTAGSIATVFPILAVLFLWQGRLINNKTFFGFIFILLSIISFASNKRAFWFIFPIVVFYFYYYTSKGINIKLIPIMKYASIALLIFYAGLRLIPSLNPEKKVGGEFDLQYALSYVYEYSFSPEKTYRTGIAHGRGVGNIMVFDDIIHNYNNINVLWGNGVDLLHATTREDQSFVKELGFVNEGALTGFARNYIRFGLVGVSIYIIYIINFIFLAKKSHSKPIYYLLLSFVLFEFFFYKGIIFLSWGLMTLFVYIVFYEYNKSTIDEYENQFLKNFGKKIKIMW